MNKLIYIIIVGVLAVTAIFAYSHDGSFGKAATQKTILVKNGAGQGHDVNVPARPQKVVFLNTSSLDMWVGAGGRETVAAYTKLATAPDGLYEKLSEKAVVLGLNNNISIELLIRQKPDLVIGNGTSSVQANLAGILREAGLPLLATVNNSVEDTFTELKLYGAMTGYPELAEKEISRIKNNIARIATTYENRKKPKVALIWGTPTSFSLLLPNCRQGEFLTLAGGQNVLEETSSSSRYVPVSLEYIAQNDPDYLFFITMGDRQKMQATLGALTDANSSWQILRAVKEKKAVILPPELFTAHYGLSIDKSIEYMNKILYPNHNPQ